MPQIPSYEGKTDPRDHLDAFNDQINFFQVNDMVRYHLDTSSKDMVSQAPNQLNSELGPALK